jgi:hypothetical protein
MYQGIYTFYISPFANVNKMQCFLILLKASGSSFLHSHFCLSTTLKRLWKEENCEYSFALKA